MMLVVMLTVLSACRGRIESSNPQPPTEKETEIEEPKADEPIEQKDEEMEKTEEVKEEQQTPPSTQEAKLTEQKTTPSVQETKPEEQRTTPADQETKPTEQETPLVNQETKPTATEVKKQFAEIEVYVAGGEDSGLNYNLDAQASQELLNRLPFDQMVLADKKEELSDIDMTSGNFVRITSSNMNTLAFYQSKEQVLCIVGEQTNYYDPPQGIYDTSLALAKEFSTKALPDGTWS